MPPLGLCMIVKDEAKALPRTLRSIKGVITALAIVDTGSIDGTLDIARAEAESLSARLRILEVPFVDYATSRNQALGLLEQGWHSPPRYALMLSADEVLVDGEGLVKFLAAYEGSETCFLVTVQTDVDVSAQPRVVKIGSPWRYEGTVHERLVNRTEKKDPTVLIPGVVIEHTESDPKRRLRRLVEVDAPLLKQQMADPSSDDSTRCRALLLLGQTYQAIAAVTPPTEPGSAWLSHMTSALGLFLRRIEVGGDRDEIEQATAHYLNVMETVGLYDDKEMIKRLDPLAESKLPEIQFMIAAHVARLDANAGYERAVIAARTARDALASPSLYPVNRSILWNAHLVAAHCAKALGDTEAMRKSAAEGIASGGPPAQFEGLT